MKHVDLPYVEELNTVQLPMIGELMSAKAAKVVVDTVNWPEYGYKPSCVVYVARSNESVFLHYMVRGYDLRAVQSADFQLVHEDSCVEFFVHDPASSSYFNFEFNCIGVCNASKRRSRHETSFIAAEAVRRIKRYSSVGTEPFEERGGLHAWELSVEIPFEVMEVDPKSLPALLRGNFYKCGDKTSHPHFLSWNPIVAPQPDFHRPECFGELRLTKP